MGQMRLQKFIAAAGVCSRRKAEKHIVAGRVRVNGEIVTVLGSKIDPETDRVEFDRRELQLPTEQLLIALHKPIGYVTSCDHPGQKTVMELVDLPQRIYPVGRLDKDSEGLLLLTNTGHLHHRLAHPGFDHQKIYDVTVQSRIADGALWKLRNGVVLSGRKTRPAQVERLGANRFKITLKEGRNRQIRRMVAKVGNTVTRLRRIQMANIRLGRLAPGQWRHLSASERKRLLALTGDGDGV